MKIIALRAENFKRLQSVYIEPSGAVVRLTGKNGAGKSSCLDAIAYALGGADMAPGVPIRRGQDAAQVSVDLGEFIVTRRDTEAGSSLTIRAHDGSKFASPQGMLDKIIGRLSFDPLAFTRAKPADQVEILRKLVGLDFGRLNAQRAGLFEDRTGVNRHVTQLKGAVARMPVVDAPDEEVSVEALLAEQEKRLAQERRVGALARAVEEAVHLSTAARGHVVAKKLLVADIEQRIAELQQRLADAKDGLLTAESNVESAGREEKAAIAARAGAVPPNLDGIRKQLAEAEGVNARVRAKKDRAKEAKYLAEKEAESAALTKQIEELDAQKQGQLEAAKFPVPGLSFSETGVTLNALPLDQASSAEQLRVSVAIGAALNPQLRVSFVRDGSLLDEASLALIAETAEKLDLQVWMERVAGAGETGILIEDGMVDGLPAPPPPAKAAPPPPADDGRIPVVVCPACSERLPSPDGAVPAHNCKAGGDDRVGHGAPAEKPAKKKYQGPRTR